MNQLLKHATLSALFVGAILCTSLVAHADRGRDGGKSDRNGIRSGASSDDREVHLRAVIIGTGATAAARGTAESETKSNGGQELEVKVSAINLQAGTVLSISVGGVNVGTARVTRGRISFKARGTSVPAIGPGSSVVLQTSDGTTVASGSF